MKHYTINNAIHGHILTRRGCSLIVTTTFGSNVKIMIRKSMEITTRIVLLSPKNIDLITSGSCRFSPALSTTYMAYMDLDVRRPREAAKLDHSLTSPTLFYLISKS